MEEPDGSASYNNRSLALRKTFGLTKDEWELSVKDCSHWCFKDLLLFEPVLAFFLALNFTTFVLREKKESEKNQYRTGIQ